MRNEDDENEENDSFTLVTSEELNNDESNELGDATDSYFNDNEENDKSTQNDL